MSSLPSSSSQVSTQSTRDGVSTRPDGILAEAVWEVGSRPHREVNESCRDTLRQYMIRNIITLPQDTLPPWQGSLDSHLRACRNAVVRGTSGDTNLEETRSRATPVWRYRETISGSAPDWDDPIKQAVQKHVRDYDQSLRSITNLTHGLVRGDQTSVLALADKTWCSRVLASAALSDKWLSYEDEDPKGGNNKNKRFDVLRRIQRLHKRSELLIKPVFGFETQSFHEQSDKLTADLEGYQTDSDRITSQFRSAFINYCSSYPKGRQELEQQTRLLGEIATLTLAAHGRRME